MFNQKLTYKMVFPLDLNNKLFILEGLSNNKTKIEM